MPCDAGGSRARRVKARTRSRAAHKGRETGLTAKSHSPLVMSSLLSTDQTVIKTWLNALGEVVETRFRCTGS